jgi:hypothetical protein
LRVPLPVIKKVKPLEVDRWRKRPASVPRLGERIELFSEGDGVWRETDEDETLEPSLTDQRLARTDRKQSSKTHRRRRLPCRGTERKRLAPPPKMRPPLGCALVILAISFRI